MTTQPENRQKTEQKISKDELSDKDMEKVTGGGTNTTKGTSGSPSESLSLNFTKINTTYSG
jgi:hypothetical protein